MVAGGNSTLAAPPYETEVHTCVFFSRSVFEPLNNVHTWSRASRTCFRTKIVYQAASYSEINFFSLNFFCEGFRNIVLGHLSRLRRNPRPTSTVGVGKWHRAVGGSSGHEWLLFASDYEPVIAVLLCPLASRLKQAERVPWEPQKNKPKHNTGKSADRVRVGSQLHTKER